MQAKWFFNRMLTAVLRLTWHWAIAETSIDDHCQTDSNVCAHCMGMTM